MAAPAVAGSAALVRQYYREGWYPTGAKRNPDKFTPTAALIKATLINSSVEVTGAGAYDNGQIQVPTVLLDIVAVTKENLRETVVKDGFHPAEQIFGPATPP